MQSSGPNPWHSLSLSLSTIKLLIEGAPFLVCCLSDANISPVFLVSSILFAVYLHPEMDPEVFFFQMRVSTTLLC